MNRQEVLADIQYIKEVISSSTRYTNLSGIAAIISGIIGLFACILSGWVMGDWRATNDLLQLHGGQQAIVWAGFFLSSMVTHLHFIMRKAKQTGQPAWSRLARLIVYAFSPPLLIGGTLTVFLILQQQLLWIPAIWMMCYGLGVWSGGLFTIFEPRWLGVAFMITGAIVLFGLLPYTLVAMALTFGVCHIVYGIWIYSQYGG